MSTYIISGFTLAMPVIRESIHLTINILFLIDIFYPSGEPISPYLLRSKGFAVKYYSFILCASHLRQPRLVNNPG